MSSSARATSGSRLREHEFEAVAFAGEPLSAREQYLDDRGVDELAVAEIHEDPAVQRLERTADGLARRNVVFAAKRHHGHVTTRVERHVDARLLRRRTPGGGLGAGFQGGTSSGAWTPPREAGCAAAS